MTADPNLSRIAAWLLHALDGSTLRAVGRAQGRPASTVLRRVRWIEDRAEDPILAVALALLSDAARDGRLPSVTPDAIAGALGTSWTVCRRAMREIPDAGGRLVIDPNLGTALAQFPSASVAPRRIPMPVGLIFALAGLTGPADRVAASTTLAAPLRPVRPWRERAGIARASHPFDDLLRRNRGFLSAGEVALGRTLMAEAECDPEGFGDRLAASGLGGRAARVLRAMFVDRRGAEDIERGEGLPQRSCKAVIAVSLETLASSGVLYVAPDP